MNKREYLLSYYMLIITNSLITIEGANLKKIQSTYKLSEGITQEKREQNLLDGDYYEETHMPVSYDFDYYPYRSYMYDGNEEEPYDAQDSSERKHKTKRRGSKDKKVSDSTAKISHLNNQKMRIKSQKKCKNNLKTKSKRYTQLQDGSQLGKFYNMPAEYLNNNNGQSMAQDIKLTSENSQSNMRLFNKNAELNKYNPSNYASIMKDRAMDFQNPSLGADGFKLEELNPSNHRSPYDYLHIFNRSHKDLEDLNEEKRFEISPHDFDTSSLKEILSEQGEGLRQIPLPQCPAIRNAGESIQHAASISPEQKMNDIRVNYRNNEFGGNQELRRIEYEKKPLKQDLRTKREQKVRTFTLSFPDGKNLGSFISLKDWPNEVVARKNKGTKINPDCTTTKKTTTPRCTTTDRCATTTEECITTTECTTVADECTTSECAVTEEESTTDISCATRASNPKNFKELNEGNKFLVGLSNYVPNLLTSGSFINATVDRKSKKQLLGNNDRLFIPLMLNKNKYGVIKFEPHNLKERSGDLPMDINDNIFIVKLLKDLSSLGQLQEIPLQAQNINYAPNLSPEGGQVATIIQS